MEPSSAVEALAWERAWKYTHEIEAQGERPLALGRGYSFNVWEYEGMAVNVTFTWEKMMPGNRWVLAKPRYEWVCCKPGCLLHDPATGPY